MDTKKNDSFMLVPVIVLMAGLVIAAESHNSGGYTSSYTTPASAKFIDSDATYAKYIYSEGPHIMWCASITKWKADWMPKGYIVEFTQGTDQTSHAFKTLAEADTFAYSTGCGK